MVLVWYNGNVFFLLIRFACSTTPEHVLLSFSQVRVGVELYCADTPAAANGDCSGTVMVRGTWRNSTAVLSGTITIPAGTSLIVNLTVPHTETVGVRLWHPNGQGDQHRYQLTAVFTAPGGRIAPTNASRLIGFRHVALVTMNDTSPAAAAMQLNGTTHTGAFTMLFRVNGAAVYARGGAKIPMDLMEGRWTAYAHRRLVQSAAEANFNLIRIWGGSNWAPRAFYDACDEFGILLFHDSQYDRDDEPLGSPDQWLEIKHQIRRLSHHPSIAAWTGGNEMYQPLEKALDRILTEIASHDKSRPVWPASPGCGWLSGVDPLSARPCGARNPGQAPNVGSVLCATAASIAGDLPPLQSIPNGNSKLPAGVPMVRPPGPPYPLEFHGPYSMPSDAVMPTKWPKREVNDGAEGPGTRPVFTGPNAAPGFFISEFGCSVWQSFESMSGTLSPGNWGMVTPATGGNRNHGPGAMVQMFGAAAVNVTATGEKAFKRQLYQSMVAQMLLMKAHIEALRSSNVFGTSFWMFNVS